MDGLAAGGGVTGGSPVMPNPFAFLSSVGGASERPVCRHRAHPTT
jgi:hypothetical protein